MMRLARIGLAFALGFAVPTHAQVALTDIEVKADGEIDLPRILDLFALKVGDVVTEGALEQAVVRVAQGGGRFQGIRGEFDPDTGRARLVLRLGNRVQSIDLRISAGATPSGESVSEELSADLLLTLGVARGDIVTSEVLSELRPRLAARLRDRGYPNAKIVLALEERPGLSGRILLISVETGARVFVKKLRLQGFRSRDVGEFFSFMRSYSDLRQIIEGLLDPARGVLRAGETARNPETREIPFEVPLDWIDLSDSVNQWAQAARAAGYFDFRTSLEILEENDSGQLILSIRLERGPRYDIQFEGNVAFWERELRDKVTDRSVRLGVPFSTTDAEVLLRRIYFAEGAKDVRISTTSTDGDDVRRILFRLEEGPFFFVRGFAFDRGAESDAALAARVLKAWRESNQSPFRRIPFDERLLSSWTPDLVRRLRAEGFLQARILEMRPTFKESSRAVDVEIAVQLGPRVRLSEVSVLGDIALSDAEMDRIVTLEPGQWANPDRVLETAIRLREAYLGLGFLNARVAMDEKEIFKASSDGSTVAVELKIEPGPQVRVGRPLVVGLARTKERVVTREFSEETLGAGQLWTPDRQRRLEENLLGLGIFGSVQTEASGGRRISEGRASDGSIEVQEKDVRLTAIERPAGSVEFGPGFRTDLGLVAFAEFSYRNLGGWNRGLVTRAQVSRKLEDYQFPEQKYSLVYLEPYLAGLRLKFRAAAEFLKEDDVNFVGHAKISGINREEISLAFSLERDLYDRMIRWTHNLYTISLPRIEAFDEVSASRRATYRIGSVGSGLTFDFRDNIFNPRRGFLGSTSLEYAASALGSDADANFFLWRNSATFYVPTYGASTIALYGAYHRMFGFGSSQGLPENRRLLLGGRNSVRSLPENFLRFDAKGVLAMQAFEVKAEFRQPILLDLGLAFFVDGGQVDVLRAIAPLDETSTGFRTGIGVGLRYVTPVGPLALDLAYNVDRRKDESDVKIQFAIGSF